MMGTTLVLVPLAIMTAIGGIAAFCKHVFTGFSWLPFFILGIVCALLKKQGRA
jgi:hypothetical protein